MAADSGAALSPIPRGVAILGSTGSIGTTALRVIDRHPDRFRVTALTAFNNVELLREQAARHSPSYVGCVHGTVEVGAPGRVGAADGVSAAEAAGVSELTGAAGDPGVAADRRHQGAGVEWRTGAGCLVDAATHPDADIVLNAIVGAAGLDATLAALEAGKRVALANKESLVLAGDLVAAACRRGGGEIVPVDSEHSAILQCLAGRARSAVRRVVLTASGGPFRDWSPERLAGATLDDALQHPTWSMGRKITIDSATLANKALEVIEAHFLFGLPYDRIDVVVHPQSVVHSFVEFVDGSVLAQLGVPSMELPVLYALTHPDRVDDTGVPAFDPVALSPLTFEPVRHEVFPALRLGIRAGCLGGAAPAVFNASNEEAVALFLAGRIRFGQIATAIESALGALGTTPAGSRDALLDADASARRYVRERFA